MKINIKPLSVNDAWQGKRFKTPKYKQWEKDALMLLPAFKIHDNNIELNVEWGFSSAGSDIDNPLKPFLDVLQKKYNFNDNRIYRLVIEKKKVKKGNEYIKFDIK